VNGDYPEDWQEQGWCCRECAVMAWNSLSPEMRSLFTETTTETTTEKT
jgi:hypothetical protein